MPQQPKDGHKPSTSQLTEDPHYWASEKQLRKELGKKCQKLWGGKKKRVKD